MLTAMKNLKKSKMSLVLLAGLFLFAFGALFLTGCSQSPVNNSQTDSSLSSVQAFEQVIESPSLVKSRIEIDDPEPVITIVGNGADLQTIGPDGGTLNLHIDTEDIVFVVPAGALDSNVTISITGHKGVDQYGKVNFQYDCLPAGLTFNQSMVLYQPWPFGGTYVKSYFKSDEIGSDWTLEEVSAVVNQMTTLHIDHFSKYGISN